MTLKVFNTLTGRKEDFSPLVPGKIGMYVCGVTVYDMCHIGHARAYICFDMIQRYLRYSGNDVTYVRNFTDVDDKIINRARERGEQPEAVSERFIREFQKDMASLGVAHADIEPKVTDHIPEIIRMIETIISKGHAYIEGGDVYFSVRSFPGYLKLSGRQLEDMKAGARVEVDERKRDPMDFALWKESRPGEPWWESPWGRGRPGWHIECSAMSSKYLGETFDIHGGGKDLIFPHHENEIAQSEAASGRKFVIYWMHNGFVNIDEEKMSKSLGNFFTIREITSRYHPEALRYFMLTTHYRSPINFSLQSIEEAQKRIEYAYQTLEAADSVSPRDSEPGTGSLLSPELVSGMIPAFREAMDDDFNAARTLGEVSNALRLANDLSSALSRKHKTAEKAAVDDMKRTIFEVRRNLLEMGSVLGIMQGNPSGVLVEIRDMKADLRGLDRRRIEELVDERAECRNRKDFRRADEVRNELKAMGVELMDNAAGTSWRIA
jgi:cysteinyl-tRNA synthetase